MGEGQVSFATSIPALHSLCNSGDQRALSHGPGRPQRSNRQKFRNCRPSKEQLKPLAFHKHVCFSVPQFPYLYKFSGGQGPSEKETLKKMSVLPGQGSPSAAPALNSKVAGKMAMPLYGDRQQVKCILGKHKKTIYSLRRSQWPLQET